MVEFWYDGDYKLAIARDQVTVSDLEKLALADVLQLSPAGGELQLPGPLQLPNLLWLRLDGCRQPMRDLVTRGTLQHLEKLIVADSAECAAQLPEEGRLPLLKDLTITHQCLTDDVQEWIANQTTLRILALNDTNATDATLASLQCRDVLRAFILWRSGVSFSDDSLFDAPFPRVRNVHVESCPITSSSVPIIRRLFPILAALHAEDTALGLDEVKEIATWDSLIVLHTGNPDVDFDRHQQCFWDYDK